MALSLIIFLSVAHPSQAQATARRSQSAKPAESLSQLSLAAVQKRAESGDVRAQLELGKRYFYGYGGVLGDYGKAVRWFEHAAAKGSAEAEEKLGVMYMNGNGFVEDPAKADWPQAADWVRKAADQGYADAACTLGWLYSDGRGVAQNPAQATVWYGRALTTYLNAASRGDSTAERELGDDYFGGTCGLKQDDSLARSWYSKAATGGDARAANDMANTYDQPRRTDLPKAIPWYEQSVRDGGEWGGDSANRLGMIYSFDQTSHLQDYALAIVWFRKAAELGNITGMYMLGRIYEEGLAARKNPEEALELYRKAAAQGDSEAENQIGRMYQNGVGLTRDYQQALAWYQKAATFENADAENNLGWMYQHGLGVQADNAQATAWYQKAIAHGNSEAKQNLAALNATIASAQHGASSQQVAAEQRQVPQHSPYYTGNKSSDAKCAEWTPTSTDVTFSIKAVNSGAVPEDVVFSMTNTSGCQVAVRAIGKIIGTERHIYTTTATPGQPDSLEFKGFSDAKTVTPFTSVLSPNVQEQPASAEIDDIKVCSATPPSDYPNGSYFDPFRNGKCATFANTGPVSFTEVTLIALLDTSWSNKSQSICLSVGYSYEQQLDVTVKNCGNSDAVFAFAQPANPPSWPAGSFVFGLHPGQQYRFGERAVPYHFWGCPGNMAPILRGTTNTFPTYADAGRQVVCVAQPRNVLENLWKLTNGEPSQVGVPFTPFQSRP